MRVQSIGTRTWELRGYWNLEVPWKLKNLSCTIHYSAILPCSIPWGIWKENRRWEEKSKEGNIRRHWLLTPRNDPWTSHSSSPFLYFILLLGVLFTLCMPISYSSGFWTYQYWVGSWIVIWWYGYWYKMEEGQV